MRRHTLSALMFGLTLAGPALAESPVRVPGNFGIGSGMGGAWYAGLSLKHFNQQGNATQALLGLGPEPRLPVMLMVDRLRERTLPNSGKNSEVGWNYGWGPSAAFEGGFSQIGAGVHGTVGLEFNLELASFPIDLCLDYKAGIYVIYEPRGAQVWDLQIWPADWTFQARVYPF